jgi:hypothetical protein
VGYSQGAGIIRSAAPALSASVQEKILAVVMFGDPGMRMRGRELPPILQGRLFENCANGDPVSSLIANKKKKH